MLLISKYYTLISECTFEKSLFCSSKNLQVLLKVRWVFVILLSVFVVSSFRRAVLLCRNVEGVHGQRKVGNP